ncbi:prolipoprotein diacylglyceryl transferase, partial [Saprospiraceae bacterium]|nr:prolipoprotein diacylglyceryl transferase [Saprospiraceae bacterium]
MWPIIWDTDPEIIKLFGNISIRWYSLLFAGGLVAGFQVSKNLFLTDRWSMEDIDKLALFVFIATILGARLGHCLFYEPDYYLSHPLEMLL